MLVNAELWFHYMLKRVLNDERTNYSLVNKTFLISCPIDYYFPFFLISKEKSVLTKIKIKDTTYYNVHIIQVVDTKENDTYLTLSVEYYYDESKHLSQEEFQEKFTYGTKVNYDDYKKYENEFYHFKTAFEIDEDENKEFSIIVGLNS